MINLLYEDIYINSLECKDENLTDEKKEELKKSREESFEKIFDIEKMKDSTSTTKKYAMKMATSTGKTWVINAMIIWQYLNAIEGYKGFAKNFLIMAPGLIVYDRLLESFRGSEHKKGDIQSNINLFVPNGHRDSINSLLDSVKDKENLRNVTNNSIILINWHLFLDKDKKAKNLDEVQKEIIEKMPAKPGKTSGNDLNILDRIPLEIEKTLSKLDNLMVINDEAHHIHGEEIVWQQSLKTIEYDIGTENFIQLDFTATPYKERGSVKHYFYHCIVDFDLVNALSYGLTKLVLLENVVNEKFEKDDYKAIIESNGKKSLSSGQQTLIKMGLKKRNDIEKKIKTKIPKLMITVEDTTVVEPVVNFLVKNGLKDNNILAIHSGKKGELSQDEYKKLKDKLFNIDYEDDIKVVVSVLMLKEGFDSNNICVIVPLRATNSPILLEQTIGRGLRLMFRDIDNRDRAKRYKDIVNKNSNPLKFEEDTLHIIEHPAFKEFYKDLMGCVVSEDTGGGGGEVPVLLLSQLKEDYKKYDLFFFKDFDIDDIEFDTDEITDIQIDVKSLPKYTENTLEKLLSKIDETLEINSIELTTTNIVYSDVTNIGKKIIKKLDNPEHLLGTIINDYILEKFENIEFLSHRSMKKKLDDYLYEYISNIMFDVNFDFENGKNYKIFEQYGVMDFVGRIFANTLNEYLKGFVSVDSKDLLSYFSQELPEFKVREKYHLKLTKTPYTLTPFPANKGGLEKLFLETIDKDSNVERFVKILENRHKFMGIEYLNNFGGISKYYPDFIVEIVDKIYIIETKASKDVENDVVQTKKRATIAKLESINELPKSIRKKEWEYVILTEKDVVEDRTFLQMISSS